MRDLIRFDDAQKAVCDGCSRQFGDEVCEPAECLIQEALVHILPVDAAPVRRGEWVLEESPYAEHEEAMDGESHPRYVCSLCHCEAGFGCDPDGFATDQDRSNFCPNCGADMRTARDPVNGEWEEGECL